MATVKCFYEFKDFDGCRYLNPFPTPYGVGQFDKMKNVVLETLGVEDIQLYAVSEGGAFFIALDNDADLAKAIANARSIAEKQPGNTPIVQIGWRRAGSQLRSVETAETVVFYEFNDGYRRNLYPFPPPYGEGLFGKMKKVVEDNLQMDVQLYWKADSNVFDLNNDLDLALAMNYAKSIAEEHPGQSPIVHLLWKMKSSRVNWPIEMINFAVVDFNEELHKFSLPRETPSQMFIELKKVVVDVLGVEDQKIFWNDGDSHISLDSHHALEAAVDYAIIIAKRDGKIPVVHIGYMRERKSKSARGVAKPSESTTAAANVQEKEIEFKQIITEMWAELKKREMDAEAREKAVADRENAVQEKEEQLDRSMEEMNNAVVQAIRDEMGASNTEMKERMESMEKKLEKLTKQLSKATLVAAMNGTGSKDAIEERGIEILMKESGGSRNETIRALLDSTGDIDIAIINVKMANENCGLDTVDINRVISQTGVSVDRAIAALQDAGGDYADAILAISIEQMDELD